MRLVYDAGPVTRLAPVDQPPPDGSLEEARAAVACEDPVMFAGACVSTYTADEPSTSSLSRDITTLPVNCLSSPSFPGRSGASLRSERESGETDRDGLRG